MQTTYAETQYKLSTGDMEILLALVRGGTLGAAGARLGVDASTVFRTVQRIEKGVGQRLFERSRAGYLALELAREIAGYAEHMEVQLEAARSALQGQPESVAGAVRITSTDSFLHCLVAPQLPALAASHPGLRFELHAGNELANLTQREADIALRATRRPPGHLVGRHVGPVRVALFAARAAGGKAADADWVAPDDALPDHPSVLWRKHHYPKVVPKYSVGSILTVAQFVGMGLGIGVLPLFLAREQPGLLQISEVLDECQTELWLLTHPESRYLRRVSTVAAHLAGHLALP